jgi:crotonobetaine/carnitine-CoA ligase
MTSPVPSYDAGERDTLVRALDRAVGANGDAIFFDIEGEAVSFAEFDRRTTRFANALIALGVSKGDVIVTISETHPDTIMFWFAIAKTGAIWAPINLAYRGEFLRHQIVDTGARLILCDADYLDRVVEIADDLPEVERILCRGAFELSAGCSIAIEQLERYRGTDPTPVRTQIEPGDLAALIYTSGTTGPSKGCMISHNYMCMQGRQHRRAVGLGPGVVQWTPLPLFHAFALSAILGALITGQRISISPRFSVSSFWDDVERSGASRAMLMASIFPLVAYAPDTAAMQRSYGQLKMILGVPISPEVRRIWEERFGLLYGCSWCYGQTEVNRLGMVPYGERPPELCAGRAADEFEVMILDGDGIPVATGEVGEICYRPRHPNVMFEGYWRRPEETALAWRHGWARTGDLGRMDEQGYFYFVDRAKDYLRSRGENVSSFEVEKSFLAHPAILEIAVHAIAQQNGEDEIKATIVLKPGAETSARELCLWAIDKLPYFAVPRYFEIRSELVKNPTGRVLKFQLREEGVTSTTWDRDAAGIHVRRPKRKAS